MATVTPEEPAGSECGGCIERQQFRKSFAKNAGSEDVRCSDKKFDQTLKTKKWGEM